MIGLIRERLNKVMDHLPLRRKLIGTNLAILGLGILIFTSTTYFGLVSLSTRLSDLSKEQSERVKLSYQEISQEKIEKIRSIYLQGLSNKANQMLSKDSVSLAPMIADNSFMAVRDFLLNNFEGDSDLIFAAFYTEQDGDISAWQLITSEHPKGLMPPINYNKEKKGWEGKKEDGSDVFVFDPDVLEQVKLNELQAGFAKVVGKDNQEEVFKGVIPFYEGENGSKVEKARQDGEAIGFLRYTLSPKEMNQAIASEKENLQKQMVLLKEQNQKDLKRFQEVQRWAIWTVFIVLFLATLVIVGLGLSITRFSADKITGPVNELTELAEQMSKGQYDLSFTLKGVHSEKDEIGILARAFQVMGTAIRKRDADLAEINRNLEKTVEMRTSQLRDELRKIEGLLNNMKQAVFAVDPQYAVVAPVSKFSETVFGKSIEKLNVFDFLFHQLNKQSEEWSSLKSALSVVFGADELQWDLAEDNLLRKVVLHSSNEGMGQVLKINYGPMFDEEGNVKQVMMVVEDITDMEKLGQEVQLQKEKAERLQQLAECGKEFVSSFFQSAVPMISKIQSYMSENSLSTLQMAEIFRYLHTIKGNSRGIGLKAISHVTHEVENSVEGFRHYVHQNSAERIQLTDAEKEIVTTGILKIRSQVEGYLQLSSFMYGIENEIGNKIYNDFHNAFVDLDWCWSNPDIDQDQGQDNINQQILAILNLSKENGKANLQAITEEAARHSDSPKNDGFYRDIVNEGLKILSEGHKVPAHQYFTWQWVTLGEKLDALTDGLSQKVFSSTLTNNLGDAIEFAKNNNFILFAEYLLQIKRDLNKVPGQEIKGPQALLLKDLTADMWKQYFFAAGIFHYFYLTEEERESVQRYLLGHWNEQGKFSREGEDQKISKSWFLSFLKAVSRNKDKKLNPEIWVQRTGWTKDDIVIILTGNADLMSTLVQKGELTLTQEIISPLLAYLSRGKDAFPKDRECPTLWKEHFFNGQRTFLKWYDYTQHMISLWESPEAVKVNSKTVDIYKRNIQELRDDIFNFWQNGKISEENFLHFFQTINSLENIPAKRILWSQSVMVETIAKNLNKKVDFKVIGDNVMMSRFTINTLRDAIIQLLRNMVDHGIETPEERLKIQKPEVGKVTIECRKAHNGQISLYLHDDGKGMDPNDIFNTAVRKGFLEQNQEKLLSDQEKLELIFLQGFSVRQQVSEYSGRGVGMDIVKKSIESLGAKISVYTHRGQGTTFQISLSNS